MSFKNVQGSDTVSKNFENRAPIATPWVRNPTWAAMPSITSSNEEVDMLVAVYPDSSFMSFQFSTSTGTYTVDWGDSTTSTGTSGNPVYHQYTFSDSHLANTNGPVTFTDSGDTVNRTAHGYTNGMSISFATIVTTTGIVPQQIYYVVGATANTFQVAATPGGSALPLTTDGSGTILVYKQAIVKVTCTTGGAHFTAVQLQIKNNTTGLNTYVQPVLDLQLSTAATSMIIGGTTVYYNLMERCTILRHSCTSLSSLFKSCASLQSVPLFDTSAVTTMSNMFDSCALLQSVPLLNTGACTTMASMFQNCYSLLTVPMFDTHAVTNMSSMFLSCQSLLYVPLLNTSACTTMANMFMTCTALTAVPLFDTHAVTSFTSTFSGCTALASVPLFNTVANLQFNATFLNCSALTSVPLFNTGVCNTMSQMLSGCRLLQTTPLFNTGAVTTMANMFQNCTSLVSVPLYNTSACTTMASMFNGCASLVSVPLFDTHLVNTMSGMFTSCLSLPYVPLFNTVAVTVFSSMFNNCTSLLYCPGFDTTAVTGTTAFTSMFNGCLSLGTVGAMNLGQAAITTSASYNTMFNACTSLYSIAASTGPKFTFTVANAKLSGTALDALYTSLPTVTSQTITVSGNWGIASDTPSIATGKGWTVTGS